VTSEVADGLVTLNCRYCLAECNISTKTAVQLGTVQEHVDSYNQSVFSSLFSRNIRFIFCKLYTYRILLNMLAANS